MKRKIGIYVLITVLILAACSKEVSKETKVNNSETAEKVPDKKTEEKKVPDKNESTENKESTNSSNDDKNNENKGEVVNKQNGEKQTDKILTTYKSIEEKSINDVEDTVDKLTKKIETLSAEINSYDSYKNNTNKVENLYKEIINEHMNLGIRIRKNCIEYVNLIIKNENGFKKINKLFKDVYENIYDDSKHDMYEIYDNVMKKVYKAFYNGVLRKKPDMVEYSEWYNLRSDEYDMWSDSRSTLYDDWSDMSSDVYDFLSDVSSKSYNEDLDGIKKKINKFENKVKQLSSQNESVTK